MVFWPCKIERNSPEMLGRDRDDLEAKIKHTSTLFDPVLFRGCFGHMAFR